MQGAWEFLVLYLELLEKNFLVYFHQSAVNVRRAYFLTGDC